MTESNEKQTTAEQQATPGPEQQTPQQTHLQEEPASSEQGGNRKEKKHKEAKAEEIEAHARELETAFAAQTEQLKRILAEYDNFRKRTLRERESFYADTVCMTVATFLPILDNLERAAAGGGGPEGIKLILRQFYDILEKLNVQPFGGEGDPFDPQKHNALLHADGEGGCTVVAQILKKGYAQGERIIRPADVKTTD